MNRQLAALFFVVGLVGGCAPAVVPFGTPIPGGGKIDKFFVVLVTEDASKPGGCAVNVQPKVPSTPDPNHVKVKHNFRVAWFVVNTCQAGVTPTIDFYLKSDPNKTKQKFPVDFTDADPGFLIGKVKDKPQNCNDMDEDAPCTTFNYTIHFGSAFEDPEIEIVM